MSERPPHDPTLGDSCECFRCHVAGINIGAAALPTRKPGIISKTEFAQKATKDNEAYRRLRREGYQPRGVKNAAIAEATAESRFELETGYRLSSSGVGNKFDEVQDSIHKGEIMGPMQRLDA
jgi:hypothetical protein